MGHSSELRPYQLEALQEISEAFLERRVNKQLLVLPTGTGKTVVFAHLLRHPSIAAWLAQFPPRERRVLILAHREELLEQAKATLARINPELRVSIEQGARNVAEDCDVVVASVQTIGRRGTDRLQRLGSGRFRIVIVDEAHHAPARTYLNVLEHFAPDAGHEASSSARLILGVTATPERADDVGLACAFDEIVYAKSLREMIDSGYLCRLRAFRIETSESLDGIHTRGGDFLETELARRVNRPRRNELAVKAYTDLAGGRRTIVFAVDVAHANALAAVFREHGIRAASVTGELKRDDRKALIGQFHAGELDVLTNCMVLTEGFDCPEVACVLLARPTQSAALYRQMIGRGTRLSEGKPDCVILDLVDQTSQHALITLASLFGLPPKFDCCGDDVNDITRRFEFLADDEDVEGISSLDDLSLDSEEVELWCNPFSTRGWYRVGHDRYRVLTGGPDREYLIISRGPGGWKIRLNWRKRRPPHFDGFVHVGRYDIRPSEHTASDAPVFSGEWGTLEQAVRQADRWIERHRSPYWHVV